MNEVQILNYIVTVLDSARKQIELSNKIELAREANRFGIISCNDYISWIESSPFIKSIQKGENNG